MKSPCGIVVPTIVPTIVPDYYLAIHASTLISHPQRNMLES
jgi:hypothetical protein